jgi:hypothetical protein
VVQDVPVSDTPQPGKRERLSPAQLIGLVLDDDSWESWDATPRPG